MTIRSVSDVLAAYDEGRTHVQRFYKGSLVSLADGRWQDWAFAPGQPAYDARIGVGGKFNSFTAVGNDAIWFPELAPGQTRHLSEVVLKTSASNANQTSVDCVIYDLLGVYPLIDGDSSDEQLLTTDVPLPRYSDGVGVFPVLVNHVAPLVVGGAGTYTYIGHDGISRSAQFGVSSFSSLGQVSTVGANPAVNTAGMLGALSMPLVGGRGVRSVTSIQFTTTPGGLYSLYLYKPLLTLTNIGDGGVVATRGPATVKSAFENNAWHAPRIYDGAHLGMFLRSAAGGRAIASVFGHFEFIWG